jgi:hypothetical protein
MLGDEEDVGATPHASVGGRAGDGGGLCFIVVLASTLSLPTANIYAVARSFERWRLLILFFDCWQRAPFIQ